MKTDYPYQQLVLVGDSLIESSIETQDGFSFHAELQTYCNRYLDVVNRGLGGYNTAHVSKFLPKIIPPPTESSPRIAYLFILLGTNDACIPLPGTFQHVPLDEYKRNLKSIIEHPNVQAHDPTICLITPPPLNDIHYKELDTEWGYSEPSRRSETTALYAEKVRELAQEMEGVVAIDLWQAMTDTAIAKTPQDYTPGGPWLGTVENGKEGGLRALLHDSLHLSGEGFRVLYDIILPHIHLPKERVFPMWTDFDPRHRV